MENVKENIYRKAWNEAFIEGFAKGYMRAKIDVARKLKQDNFSPSKISKYTDLPLALIEKL